MDVVEIEVHDEIKSDDSKAERGNRLAVVFPRRQGASERIPVTGRVVAVVCVRFVSGLLAFAHSRSRLFTFSSDLIEITLRCEFHRFSTQHTSITIRIGIEWTA